MSKIGEEIISKLEESIELTRKVSEQTIGQEIISQLEEIIELTRKVNAETAKN